MYAFKKTVTLFVFLSVWFACYAADVITFNDGTTLSAKIYEITSNDIKYKKADNLTGPIYVVNKSEVTQILFENGDTEIIRQNTTVTASVNNNTIADNVFGSPNYTGYDTRNRVSDAMLLKQYNLNRAKKIKKTAVIGASCLAAAGIATFIGFAIVAQRDTWSDESQTELYVTGGAIGGALIIGGGTWLICANNKANKIIQQVNYLTLFEHDLISTQNRNLTAGLSLIHSKGLDNSNGVGVTLKYAF